MTETVLINEDGLVYYWYFYWLLVLKKDMDWVWNVSKMSNIPKNKRENVKNKKESAAFNCRVTAVFSEQWSDYKLKIKTIKLKQ